MTYTKTKNYPYPPVDFKSLDDVRKYLVSLRTAIFEADLGYSEQTQTAFTDPEFESLTLSDLTASRPVITDSGKTLASIAYTGATSFRANLSLEPTDSPIFVGATLSGLTASKPVFTDASKALTSSGTVPVNQGGTGLTSYAVGDLLYASGATTLAKLADVAVGRVLVSGGVGVAPAYSATPTLTSLTLSGLTAGRVVYAGVGGLLSDSANFVWDNENGQLGVKQATPLYDIDITGTLRVTGNVGTLQGSRNVVFGEGNIPSGTGYVNSLFVGYRNSYTTTGNTGGNSLLVGDRNAYFSAINPIRSILVGSLNIYTNTKTISDCLVVGEGNAYLTVQNMLYSLMVGRLNLRNAAGGLSYNFMAGFQNLYSLLGTASYSSAFGQDNGYSATGNANYFVAFGYRNAYSSTGNLDRSFFVGQENALGVAASIDGCIGIGPYRAFYNATGSLNYAIALGYQAGMNTTYNSPALFGRESQPGAHLQCVIGSSYYTGGVSLDGKNFGLGFKGAYGTNADKVLAHANGTAPTTSPADCYQMWSADQAAGNACPHIRTESGAVLKLYQQAHIADASEAHAVTDPADAPADADALRDDLVLNTIPDLETKLNALGAKINAIYTALENNGLLASA